MNERNRRFHPRGWSRRIVRVDALGLTLDDLVVLRRTSARACAAVWDQRGFKQTVIRGYAPWLNGVRPVLNCVARLARQPRLPAVGAKLAHASVSHLALASDDPAAFGALMTALQAAAARKGVEWLSLGFAENDPRLALVREKSRRREYRSRIYSVRWPKSNGAAGSGSIGWGEAPDEPGSRGRSRHRLPGPEVALL